MNPVEEFLEVKQAGMTGALKTLGRGLRLEASEPGESKILNTVGRLGTMGAISSGLVATARGLAHGAGAAYDAVKDRIDKPAQFNAMLAAHPSLQEEDPARVSTVFSSIRHFAPSLAADPLAAGSFVRNVLAVSGQQDLMMPTETAKHLTEIHKNISGGRSPASLTDIFAEGMKGGKGEAKAPAINIHAFDPVTEEQRTMFDPQGVETGFEHRQIFRDKSRWDEK